MIALNQPPPIALRRHIRQALTQPTQGIDPTAVRMARMIAAGQSLTPEQVKVLYRLFRDGKAKGAIALLGGKMGDRWVGGLYREMMASKSPHQ